MKKLILAILSLLLATVLGCSSKTKIEGNPADMSEYGVESERFIETSFSKFTEIKEDKTFVIYFGYPECDSCVNATPVLNDVLEDENAYTYYINIKNPDLYNKDTDSEILKAEVIKYYPDKDKFGVPLIMFYKNGNVEYVIEGMRNPQEEMEKAILEGFSLVK